MITKSKTEMAVGWFEVELWVVRGFLWHGACKLGAWVMN